MSTPSTDIPRARELLSLALSEDIAAISCLDEGKRLKDRIEEALSLMKRQVIKKAVRIGTKVSDHQRGEIRRIILSGAELTDTEIAQQVLGHASASGRVCEIRRAV